MDDSSELDLELAIRVDELAGLYAEALGRDASLTPEVFAANHPDVPAESLLAVIRGAGLLSRATRRSEGPFPAGTQVGPYEIRQVIGRGGMGIVYEAVERELGRVVALKAMDAIKVDDRTRARFVREARAAARLDHAAIVAVFGSGETNGVLWYAMRRVQGASLDQLLLNLESEDEAVRKGALDALDDAASSGGSGSGAGAALTTRVRAGVSLVARLTHALAYAHSRGILHRDIKPANVLVDGEGAPLLTDFGLCKVEDDASLTAGGDVVGTLRYMPPEALEGNFDARGDVYSLGLVLYELLSGRPAFPSDSRQAMLHQVLRVDPPALDKVAHGVPPDLVRVATKAISKLPEERYATAADLAVDLEAVLAGRAVRARRPSALYLARLFVRRNRALSATVALALLAAALGALAYVMQLRDANRRINDALGHAQRNEAHARIAGAEATLQSSDMGLARSLLGGVTAPHRDWMWSHLAARVGLEDTPGTFGLRDPTEALQNDEQSLLVIYGPDGFVAFERDGLREIGRLQGEFTGGAIGGDGRDVFLVRTTPRELVHVRVDDGQLIERRVRGLDSNEHRIAALEGSDVVLVRKGFKTLRAIHTATDQMRWEREFPVSEVVVFDALSEDEVVLGIRGGGVYTIHRDAPAPTTLAEHVGTPSAILVRDGQVLATGSEDGSVQLHTPLTGHTDVWFVEDGAVDSFSLARDGSGLLAVALSTRRTLLVRPQTGCVERIVTGFDAMPVGVGFGRDPWLVTATSASELATHEEHSHDGRVSLTPGLGDLGAPAVSADGRLLATYGSDWLLYLHDLQDQSLSVTPVGSRDARARPRFDGSAKYLALGRAVLDTATLTALHQIELESAVVQSGFTSGGDLVALATSAKEKARAAGAEATLILCAGIGEEGAAQESRASLGSVTGDLCAFEVRGERAFAIFGSGIVFCVDAVNLTVLWRSQLQVEQLLGGVVGKGELYLVARDGLVRVLDAERGVLMEGREWRVSTSRALQGLVSSLAIGPGPGLLTTCTNDGRVETWDMASGRRLGALDESGQWLKHVTALGDSGWMVGTGYFGRITLFGHGELPIDGWRTQDDPGFTIDDAAVLYREHEPLRRRILIAAKRSQRFRHQPDFWEAFLEGK